MKLIDKDALVAEIEKNLRFIPEHVTAFDEGEEHAYHKILSFLDTLEVKEVDYKPMDNDFERDAVNFCFNNGLNTTPRIAKTIAKHFFELGVNASNPLTWEDIKLIWTIGDEIPYMPEEDFFKEILKRFKAQKGDKV